MSHEPYASTNDDCVDAEIQALIDGFTSVAAVQPDLQDAESVERRETELRDRAATLLAKVLERDIQTAIDSERIRENERELIKGWPKKLKNRGGARGCAANLLGHRHYRPSALLFRQWKKG